MKKTLLILYVFITNPLIGSSNTIADKFYKDGNFVEAAVAYEKMLYKGQSAELLFNLGNCYYKQSNWGKAILYYEKSLKFAPTDDDILHNLKMANLHTSDKMVTASPGITMWFYSQLMFLSADSWSWIGIVLSITTALLFVAARFWAKRLYRNIARFTIVPALLFLLFGWFLNRHFHNDSKGIILEDRVDVKSAPDQNQKTAFILHEGAKVSISRQNSNWIEISLGDSRKGWVKKTTLGII
jgi:tetratricopeptide (TPR) repeat protein